MNKTLLLVLGASLLAAAPITANAQKQVGTVSTTTMAQPTKASSATQAGDTVDTQNGGGCRKAHPHHRVKPATKGTMGAASTDTNAKVHPSGSMQEMNNPSDSPC